MILAPHMQQPIPSDGMEAKPANVAGIKLVSQTAAFRQVHYTQRITTGRVLRRLLIVRIDKGNGQVIEARVGKECAIQEEAESTNYRDTNP
ncbi:MAG: hypothetical protein R3B90_21205 [Planctomycetaceae bacterium]